MDIHNNLRTKGIKILTIEHLHIIKKLIFKNTKIIDIINIIDLHK